MPVIFYPPQIPNSILGAILHLSAGKPEKIHLSYDKAYHETYKGNG
jgi:hypothetical protein